MFKLGIIGAGKIVESCHLPVLKNMKNIQVNWIMDVNINRAKLLQKMYAIPKIVNHKDWQKEIEDIDICLLTIPYGARKEYIEFIAKKKKSLYVEKPFAKTMLEHKNYCNLFSGHNLAVGFQRRYYKTVHILKSIIENKIFGSLIDITYNEGHFNLKGGSSYISNASISGGGVFIESAIHSFDQLFLLLNAIDIQIIKSTQVIKDGIDYETSLNAKIYTDSKNIIKLSTCISSLKNLNNGLKLTFENASLTCELSPNSKILINKNGLKYELIDECINPLTATSVSQAFFIFWNQFIKAIETQSENLTSGSSSILTTSFVENVYGATK